MDLSRGGRAAIDRMIEAYGFTTKQALCDQLGISSSTLANRYLRDTFPADFVIQCALETGASLHWLTTGNGAKFESATADIVTIPKKKVIGNTIYDAGYLLFDKTLLNNTYGSLIAVLENGNTYLASTDATQISDGTWLVEYDRLVKTKEIFMLPGGLIRVSDEKLTFDCHPSDISLIAKIFAKYSTC